MMVIYVPVKFEFDWTNRFWIGQTIFELGSGNKNVDGQTDRQMDKKRTNEQTELRRIRK